MEQSFFSFKHISLNLLFLFMPMASLQAGPKEDKLFLQAMEASNLQKAERFIRKGADINAKNSIGSRALLIAATNDEIENACFLLENHADIDMVNSLGHTPLMCAATHGKKRMVELLLERGADIQIRSPLGHTAAKYANRHGHLEIARIIIEAEEAGARMHQDANDSAQTADFGAFITGASSLEFIRSLAQSDPDATEQETADLVETALPFIRSKAALDEVTPLMIAAKTGYIGVIERLLNEGADPAETDKNGHTAMWHAMYDEKLSSDKKREVLTILTTALQGNATANDSASETSGAAQPDPTGKMEASDDDKETLSSGSNSTVPYPDSDSGSYEALWPDSEDTDAVLDAKGHTKLMNAVRDNDYELAIRLLKNGAGPNARSAKTKKSALFYAVRNYSDRLMDLLLSYAKADPSLTNIEEQTPLMYAADGGDDLIVERLLKSDAKKTINAVDKDGISALTRAVDKGHTEVVQLLLANGAELNPEGQGKWTPIRQAFKNKDEDIILAFLLHARERNDRDLLREVHAKIMAEELYDVLVRFGVSFSR